MMYVYKSVFYLKVSVQAFFLKGCYLQALLVLFNGHLLMKFDFLG